MLVSIETVEKVDPNEILDTKFIVEKAMEASIRFFKLDKNRNKDNEDEMAREFSKIYALALFNDYQPFCYDSEHEHNYRISNIINYKNNNIFVSCEYGTEYEGDDIVYAFLKALPYLEQRMYEVFKYLEIKHLNLNYNFDKSVSDMVDIIKEELNTPENIDDRINSIDMKKYRTEN